MTSLGAIGRLRPAPQGLLRFDPDRDLRAVIDLLELGFRDDLEARDRRWLAELASLTKAGPAISWLYRLLPLRSQAFDGLVYYEDGQLVSNVSLMRASSDVWVLANVVTHPHYRRRGIAARLIERSLESLRGKGARQAQLQVRSDNAGAQALYAGFGFWCMGSVTHMRATGAAGPTRFRAPVQGWRVERLGSRGSWQRSRRLLARAGELDRGGPTSLAVQALEHHWLFDGANDWLKGRSRHSWVAEVQGEYRAMITLLGQLRSGPHRIDMVVDPSWCGRFESALLDLALRSLARLPGAEIEAEIDSRRGSVLEALSAAGFRQRRRLDRLAHDFDRI